MSLLAGCSLAQEQLGVRSRSFAPLPLRELEERAAFATPAAWNLEPPGGWPLHVPAPNFIEHREVDLSHIDPDDLSPEEREVFESIDLTPGPGVSGPDGKRFFDVMTTQERPSEDDVVAYMALLLDVGFEIDTNAASHGFFVRDDIEWVRIAHLPLNARASRGAEPGSVGGFKVSWFEDPIPRAGYCRIVEVGGESCRE